MKGKEKYDILNPRNLIVSGVLLAVVSAFNIYAGLALAGSAAGYIVYLIFGEETLVAYTIVTFLTVTEQLGESIRLVVQIMNFLILGFLFIKKLGTQFSKYPKIPKGLKIFLSILYIALFLSFLFTRYKELALLQIIRTTIFLALIYIYYALIDTKKGVEIVINTLLTITFGFGVYLFYEFYLSNFDLLQLNAKLFNEELNIYIHKNTFAIFFAISIPLLITKIVGEKRTEQKVIFSFLMIFFLTGLIITNSRSVLLALFVSVIFLIYKINKKFLLFPAIILLIITPLIFIEPVSGWLDVYFRVERISTGRDWILQTLFNIPLKYFVFGTGPAATQFYMWEYLPFQIGSPEQMWMERHFRMLT
ncbi:MAG: hypothetical protein GXO87_09295, partial [Chlorobi bacterium]|nr:hypothetical protein [Chlorobiota bacterium]